jgi:hypothetical protein
MARFPDSRIAAARWSSQPPSSACFAAGFGAPVTSSNASLTAYSGGTVWASHPLRMAAGVSVRLSTHTAVTSSGARCPVLRGLAEYTRKPLRFASTTEVYVT